MRLPGQARLEWTIEPIGDGRQGRLVQTARFRPHGLWGLVYWYGVAALHGLVFPRMVRGIARAALASVKYTPWTDFYGSATVVAWLSDEGQTGAGGWLNATATVLMWVNAVNDQLEIALPATQSATEDADHTIPAITVSDVDVYGFALETNVSVTNGVASLASLTGLTVLSGSGVSAASVRFQGDLTRTNAALAGLVFRGTPDFNGAATVTVSVSDLGSTGAGGETRASKLLAVNVAAVNDAPTLQVNAGPLTAAESTDLSIGGVSVSDVDVAASDLRVNLTVSRGRLWLATGTGLTFVQGSASGGHKVLEFTGTRTSVNAGVATLVYQGDTFFNGVDTVYVTVSDQGFTGSGGALTAQGTMAVAVTQVNDAPTITGPLATQVINEDTALTLSGGLALVVSDVDVAGNALEANVSVSNGAVTLASTSGLTLVIGSGVADAAVMVRGTLTNVNAALNGLIYLGGANYNGADQVVVRVSDLGWTGANGARYASYQVNVTVTAVNDGPTLTVPGSQAVNEDTNLTLSPGNGNALDLSDVDAAAGVMEVGLSASNGTLWLVSTTGLTFTTGSGTNARSMVMQGTLTALRNAVAGVVYRGPLHFYGLDEVEMQASDLGLTGVGGVLTATKRFNVTVNAVNDAPVLTAPGSQTLNEDSSLTLSGSLSVSDVDVQASALSMTLTVTSGKLTLGTTSALAFTTGSGAGDASMAFTGTLTATNAALSSVVYVPNANFNGGDTLTVVVTDQGAYGAGGVQQDSRTVSITVQAVNDGPVLTAPSNLTTSEDVDLTISDVLSVADPDAAPQQVEVNVTVTQGRLWLATLSGLTMVSGSGVSDTFTQFRGTVAAVNACLLYTSPSPRD